MGQLGVGLPTFPHHTKVNLSPLSRAEPLQEATGLPRKDETSETTGRNLFSHFSYIQSSLQTKTGGII